MTSFQPVTLSAPTLMARRHIAVNSALENQATRFIPSNIGAVTKECPLDKMTKLSNGSSRVLKLAQKEGSHHSRIPG
jgi:hypothetical protein